MWPLVFLRISCLSKDDFFSPPREVGDFFPLLGEVETMPLTKPKISEQGIIIEKVIKTNSSIPRLYVVDDSVVAMTEEKEFKDRAKVIFAPGKK